MKISVKKSEVIVSRNRIQCNMQVSDALLRQVEKFKYHGVYFTSDRRLNTKISSRIGQVGAVMQELGRCVARKAELSQKAKLSVFQPVFVPVLTYDHEIWEMNDKVRLRIGSQHGVVVHAFGF